MIKSAKKIGTFCAILTGIILTGTSVFGGTFTESAVYAKETSIDIVTDLAKANNGTLFLIGNEEDEVAKEGISAADMVKATKVADILSVDIYSRKNSEMKVSEESNMEFINQFGYCEPQTIFVYEDYVTSEARIVFERPYEGYNHYAIYSFDEIYDFTDELNATDATVVTFNYKGFRYGVFVKDNKYCLAKKWDPEVHTHVYDIDEAKTYVISKLQQAFAEGEDITFIKENGDDAPIHAFLNNGAQKEEFVFYNLGKEAIAPPIYIDENGEQITTERKQIAKVDSMGDTYYVFEENNRIYIDSAMYAASEGRKLAIK